MPNTENEMKMYEDMLDKLSEEYPELNAEASALSAKMMDMEPMDDDAEDEDEMMMPGDSDAIPPELMDMDDEEEDEYTL
jgi:prefoldin subunit 5